MWEPLNVMCCVDLSAPSLSLPVHMQRQEGLGAADMMAQFKEMEQEMQVESKQSSLYIHLSQAWEKSAGPMSPPVLAGRHTVDLQVLWRAAQPPLSTMYRAKMNNMLCIPTRA